MPSFELFPGDGCPRKLWRGEGEDVEKLWRIQTAEKFMLTALLQEIQTLS